MKIPKKILARQHEITNDFLKEVDIHLKDILNGTATEMFEIRDLAGKLFIHPTHLSNTINHATGKSPCFFYEDRILKIAQNMISKNDQSIAEIAKKLTFDPSNFTKFFKKFTGQTPKQYREEVLMKMMEEKTETLTI